MLKDLRTFENGRIFLFLPKMGINVFISYSKEDNAIGLVFIMYDVS